MLLFQINLKCDQICRSSEYELVEGIKMLETLGLLRSRKSLPSCSFMIVIGYFFSKKVKNMVLFIKFFPESLLKFITKCGCFFRSVRTVVYPKYRRVRNLKLYWRKCFRIWSFCRAFSVFCSLDSLEFFLYIFEKDVFPKNILL
jgi:hypothetical protein